MIVFRRVEKSPVAINPRYVAHARPLPEKHGRTVVTMAAISSGGKLDEFWIDEPFEVVVAKLQAALQQQDQSFPPPVAEPPQSFRPVATDLLPADANRQGDTQ